MLHRSPRQPFQANRPAAVAVSAAKARWRWPLLAGLLGALAIAGDAGATSADAPPAAAAVQAPAPPGQPVARRKRPKKSRAGWDALAVTAAPSSSSPAAPVLRNGPPLAFDLGVMALAGVTIGVKQWGWGETPFHTYREGWFGKSTEFGGIDKLGHAWSAQALSDYLTWRLQTLGFSQFESVSTAAALSGFAFLAVELGDGFSHYGASYEDYLASAAGIAFSFLRNTVPGVAEKVDFRMEYLPTGHGDSLGLGDYSGKKFLLAWKLAGFDAFKDGPLRYLEIHTGYYTRGYSDWEQTTGIARSRTPYIGLGLNLTEVLFSAPSVRDTTPAWLGRNILRHIQLPYTYIATGH
jgi:Predicted periplasmic lipoprotein (DUF2279)